MLAVDQIVVGINLRRSHSGSGIPQRVERRNELIEHLHAVFALRRRHIVRRQNHFSILLDGLHQFLVGLGFVGIRVAKNNIKDHSLCFFFGHPVYQARIHSPIHIRIERLAERLVTGLIQIDHLHPGRKDVRPNVERQIVAQEKKLLPETQFQKQ